MEGVRRRRSKMSEGGGWKEIELIQLWRYAKNSAWVRCGIHAVANTIIPYILYLIHDTHDIYFIVRKAQQNRSIFQCVPSVI